jgi:hypothetical protein
MSNSLPIACTLDSGAYADRLSWIANLNRAHLRTHRLTRGVLELSYDPRAATLLRELVRREQACCAFLDFSLAESTNAVELRIGVPASSLDESELLLSPFLEGASTSPSDARPVSARSDRITRVAAVSSATAAVACGVCCVLPFAFPALALTAVGTVFALFAHIYWWALVAAIAAVSAGWLWVGWQSLSTRKRPAITTVRAMAGASLLLVVALSWPIMEPHVIGFFKH